MKDLSSLKKQLAGYSAIASVMLVANKSDAQIIYHDLDPDYVLEGQSADLLLDLDNDGLYDFKIIYQAFPYYSNGRVLPYNENEILATASTYVEAFEAGHIISRGSLDIYSNYFVTYGYGYWSNSIKNMFRGSCWASGTVSSGSTIQAGCAQYGGPCLTAVDQYAAFNLKKPDGNHFGWIRLTHDTLGSPLIIKDYAYQSQPDVEIFAGAGEIPTMIHNANSTDLFTATVEGDQLIIRLRKTSGTSRLFLLNELGEMINDKIISNSEVVMNVGQLSAAIYFAVLENDGIKQTKKVVIQ